MQDRKKGNGAPPDLSRFRGYGFHLSKVVRLHAKQKSQSRVRSMGQQCHGTEGTGIVWYLCIDLFRYSNKTRGRYVVNRQKNINIRQRQQP